MSRLKAYKKRTEATKKLDHTYVWAEKASDKEDPKGAGVTVEHRWGCFGAQKGGTAVKNASGKGDVATAKKIAGETGGKGNGIAYAVNGVCHTMCNRIMCQSRKTVNANVRGGGLSHTAYGYYGVRVPAGAAAGIGGYIAASIAAVAAWRKRCKNAGVNWRPLIKAAGDENTPEDEKMQGVLAAYAALSENGGALDAVIEAETELLLTETLGADRAHTLAPQMAEISAALAQGTGAFQPLMAQGLEAKSTDMNALADALNAPLLVAQQEYGKLLKPDEYHAIFNAAPGDDVILIEADILSEVYGTPQAYRETVEQMMVE